MYKGKMVIHIVAMDRVGTIGVGPMIPWYIPEDLKFFKETTVGSVVIMGRKTAESIGRKLMNRFNIVLTNDVVGCKLYTDLITNTIESALDAAVLNCGNSPIYIMGGAEIYRQTLEYADTVIATHVDLDVTKGVRDTSSYAFYPFITPGEWQCTHHVPTSATAIPFTRRTYKRFSPASMN